MCVWIMDWCFMIIEFVVFLIVVMGLRSVVNIDVFFVLFVVSKRVLVRIGW